jgi:AcrR family transcriptional regulator
MLMKEQPKRPYRRAEETRKHVLDVAASLFYTDGIHAVGIDRLAQDAEVTTTTLYRLFGSKDGLVLSYLEREDKKWFEWLERAVSAGGIPGFFDELDQRAREKGNRGCAFRLAMTEYPVLDCDVHCLATGNKERTRSRFRDLLARDGYADPETKADQLMLILDGIEASAADRGPESRPGPGPALVRDLLRAPG